ncbi:MAG: hypothetical protein ABIQ86_01725 [Steroidobacteraceae bacterium]
MKLLAALLVVALPAAAVSPSGCASLCGNWQLDTSQSAAVVPAVDAALQSYRDPRAKYRRGSRNDTLDRMNAELEHSLGPMQDRPQRNELRAELLTLLGAPVQLKLDARGSDIVIQGDNQIARRISAGTPKARVDANGTAKINAAWNSDRLTVTERYDRKRRYTETYALQSGRATLLVTREVQRPGMKALRIQSVYRRT